MNNKKNITKSSKQACMWLGMSSHKNTTIWKPLMRGFQNGLIQLSSINGSQDRYVHLKFRKQGIFLGKFHPYEISKSGDKISDFWVFKIGF